MSPRLIESADVSTASLLRDLERKVLASAAYNPAIIASVGMRADHFNDASYRSMFLALQEFARGNPGESAVSGDELVLYCRRVTGLVDLVCDGFETSRLGQFSPSEFDVTTEIGDRVYSNVESHVRVLDDRSRCRRITQALADVTTGVRDPDEILEAMRTLLQDDTLVRPDEPFKFESVAELMAGDHRVSYYIDNVIPVSQPGTFAGPSKGLKTSLILAAMVSLSSGRPYLGRFSIPRVVRCGMMSAESGKASIVDTLRRQLDAEGLRPSDLDAIFSEEVPRITDPSHIRALERLIRRERLEVLICDPYYMMAASDDPYNLGKQGAILKDLGSICQNTGCSIVLAHHLNKTGSREQSPDLTHLNGSGLEQFVRWWVLISRTEPYDAERGFHKLRLGIGGSAGHSDCLAVDVLEGTRADIGGRIWQLTARSESEARQDSQQARDIERQIEAAEKLRVDCDKFLQALIGHPNGATAKTIREETGIHSRRMPDVLKTLQSERKITDCMVSAGNNQTYPGYVCDTSSGCIGPSDRTGPNTDRSNPVRRSSGIGPPDHRTTTPIGGGLDGPVT